MNNIPFQDLTRLHASIEDELKEAIDDVVARSAFVGAGNSRGFEEAFAEAHAANHGVGCGSGTDALALALRALEVGPGDEVIVPSMTFVATAEAVAHVGATPVMVDCLESDLLIDPEAVEAAITPATAAVMPVHLYGTPVPFETIRSWKDRGLKVVEDAAQAHLAKDGDAFVGSAGDLACFSFYPGKNLGAFGDGGAVIANDEHLAARVAKLRDHGRSEKYSHAEIGYCTRLDGIQAAVLEVKLRHLAEWTSQRQALYAVYREHLEDILVEAAPGSVHHLVVVRVEAARREEIMQGLREQGIGCGIHYPIPLSQQPSLSAWARETPVSERAAGEILSLPMDPLMKAEEVKVVCETLRQVL